MMYSEFLSMTGKEESYISYKEYTESIEPIYMDCKLNTKQEFIWISEGNSEVLQIRWKQYGK